MATKARSQIINQTDMVQLKVTFYNTAGEPADPDLFPTIRIIQPSGNVVLGPTSAGVYRNAVGEYGFDYTLGVNASLGVWTDFWSGSVSGQIQIKELNFVVHNTQLPLTNSDGYIALGDTVGFNYSQTALQNINKLMMAVRARLKSGGKTLSYDQFGNKVYIDCDIFSPEQITIFLGMALAEINEIPHFTQFTFDDTQIIDLLFYALVQGAIIFALSSQALIEKGREMQITDNGISVPLSTVSEMLQTQYSTELTNWSDKCRLIKSNMKPSPLGAGVLTLTSGDYGLPVVRALQMRRAGRII